MIVSLDLRSCSPKSEILMPSMAMYPPAASIMRNNARAKEDLPAPVLPTIPIFSPGFTEQVNSFKTRGRPGLYRVSYSWNVNFPSWGQSARGWFSMFVQSAWKKLYLYSLCIEIDRHHFHFGDTCCSEINHVNQRFDAQLVIFARLQRKTCLFLTAKSTTGTPYVGFCGVANVMQNLVHLFSKSH